VSAFIADPVIGTTVAGVTPPGAYYNVIRSICDRHEVLFIADEIVAGLGRTGLNFGIDHWQVAPDIITVAKGLAAGYAPLAAVIVSDKIVRAIREGGGAHTQGFSYLGNPLSCAAGLAVLEHLEEHDLVRQADRRGRHLKA
jgi:adenosylmethionine-8-amino-7-oxononanoate aminotransferase